MLFGLPCVVSNYKKLEIFCAVSVSKQSTLYIFISIYLYHCVIKLNKCLSNQYLQE